MPVIPDTGKLGRVRDLWLSNESQGALHLFRYWAQSLHCLPHTHDEYNLVCCLENSFELRVEDQTFVLEPGDILAINPGQVHFGSYGKDGKESVGLTLHVGSLLLKQVLYRMSVPVDLDRLSVLFRGKVNDPGVRPLALQLAYEMTERKPGYEMVMEALFTHALVYLLRSTLKPEFVPSPAPVNRQLPSWQIVRALEYMNSRGKATFCVSELCKGIGSSSSRFIQLFKKSTGNQSPHDFYNRLIVNKAAALLSTGGFSVKEISIDLGFLNESHFCRVFRNYTGVTPGTYRSLSSPSDK